MFLLYDVLRWLSNCFKHLQIFYIVLYLPYFISVFFEIFKKKKFKFVVKLIYLSIYFSHVRLDYENINTTLLLFQKKKILYFFPLWNCTLGFFKRKKSYNLLFFPSFIFYYFELYFCWVLLIFFRYFTRCFWFYGKKKLGLRKFVNLKLKE